MSTFGTATSPLQEKGCTFGKLLTAEMPELKKLTNCWRDELDEYPSDLPLCGPTTTPLELTRLVLRKRSEICFTGYVCRNHETEIIGALEKNALDLTRIEGVTNTASYPLTRAEVCAGEFDLAPAPDDVYPTAACPSGVWQEVTLSGSRINGLGGRTTLCEDEMITVSYFIYGAVVNREPLSTTDTDQMMSYVYLPVLEVLAKVPLAYVNDGATDGSGWLPKTLLNQSRMLSTYRDGVTPDGISMFDLRPKSLQEEIEGFLAGEEDQVLDATDQFRPTPAKQRPAIPALVTGPGQQPLTTSSYIGSSVWEKHAKEVQSTDTPEITASPGRPLQYIPQLPCSVSNATSVDTCQCGRLILGDGTNTCECGVITRPDFVAKQLTSRPLSAALSSNTWEASAVIARFQQSFAAATASTTAPSDPTPAMVPVALAAARKKAGNGSGGGSSGGGSDEDGSIDSTYGGRPRYYGRNRPWLLTVREIKLGVLEALEDARYEAVAKRDAALKGVVMATTLAEVNRMQQALQANQQAHAERLAQQVASDTLLVDVRKKENEKFPVGSSKVTALMREHGHHGDQTGSRYQVMEQIACKVDNADFFKALVAATADPRTKALFTFPTPTHLLYNICATRMGGAASATGITSEYGGGLSITDFKRVEPSRPNFRGVVHLNTEVPAKGKITFVTDEARQSEEFKSIYELEDAWNSCAKVIGISFGPAWYDPFVACGQTLKALYFSNPQVYHLRLLRWLSDSGLLDWIQTLRQMASNNDYLLSRHRCDLARAKGFLTPTVIPGDGFTGTWLKDNLLDPFHADMQALVRGMVPLSEAERLHGNYSSIPHAAKPLVPSGTTPGPTTLSHARGRRSVRVGDDSQDEEDVEYETEDLGGKGGKGARAPVAVLATGRGYTFAPVKPLVTMPGHQVAQGYREVPGTVDAQGISQGPACLRFNCFGPLDPQGTPLRDVPHNCPANNPHHPLFTPGGVCSKSHAPLAGPLTWTTLAVALSLGGCRVPPGAQRPPRDPVQLQRLSEIYRRNAANNTVRPPGPASVAVPTTGPASVALGGLMLGDDTVDLNDEMWDLLTQLGYEHSYEPDARKVSCYPTAEAEDPAEEELGGEEDDDAKVRWRTDPNFTPYRPPMPGECTRVGQVVIKHIPFTFEVMDVGSRMTWQDPQGNTSSRGKSCLLNTLGALFCKYGYPGAVYRQQALIEFERTDVAGRPEYAEYAAALRDAGTLKLGMLVHMAVPERVALVVVQRRPGQAAKLMIFTSGYAEVVEFAIINSGHIMPMVCSHSPCNAILWREFEPVLEQFRQSSGVAVTKHTSRSLPLRPLRQGTWPSLGLGLDEHVGEHVEDSRNDTDLQQELGMDGLHDSAELQGDMELQQHVATELKGLMMDLKVIALSGAKAVADHLHDNGQLWTNCPILLTYYHLRVTLASLAQQYCDEHTQSFLHWLWQSAGTLEMPHPFPNFLRSVVASLVTGEHFPCSLFVALATTNLEVDDAAALVVVNLPRGEPGRFPSALGRYVIARRLCLVYDHLVEKMGGELLATRVIHGHLFVRSAPEWTLRIAGGGYTNQSVWLLRCVDTYGSYLTERSKDVLGFFSWGPNDTTPAAKQQRKERNKQMRDRLSREAATTKTLDCVASMKGCWKLNEPFLRPPEVESPSLSRTGRSTPAKAKKQTKRTRQESTQDEESTDVGSASTKSTKVGTGWRGYEEDRWVERETGQTTMRSPHEISEDMARKYPLSELEQAQRQARDRRNALRGGGATLEHSIDLVSPEALLSPEEILSLEVIPVSSNHVDETESDVEGTTEEKHDVPFVLETDNRQRVGEPVIEKVAEERVLTNTEANRGCIFPNDGQHRYKLPSLGGSYEGSDESSESRRSRCPQHGLSSAPAAFTTNARQKWTWSPVICWAWRSVKRSRWVSWRCTTHGHKADGFQRRLRWAVRRKQLCRWSRCRPDEAASQRWRSDEDDSDDDAWAHIELSGTEEDEQSDARQKDALRAAQDMLKHDSPEVLELQPLVKLLKEATVALKSALVSKEPAGDASRKQLQGAYLAASNRLCHAAVALCNTNRWPQLFLAAYRASHPGRVNPLVDPAALRQAFEGLIDDTVLRTVVAQATDGQEVYLSRPRQSGWPRETPTAKMYKDEVWRTVWTDAAYESTFVFGPECKEAMDLANMQGYPLHRIPKRDTATGQPTGKGRLIADLSFENKEGHSINSMTLIDLYDKFRMPTHADIARDILLLRHWFPKLAIVISKLDVARAFRQKLLSVGSFGVFAFLLSGHFGVDQAFVFGHSAAPSVYASSGQAIHEGHNASGIHFSGEELREAGYIGYENLSPQQKCDGIWINFFSRTYCDDGILVALKWKSYQDASMDSYKKFMVAALGPEAISDKNPEEQEWREQQTVIGHVFSLGSEPDERGDKDFLSPTPERIQRMLLVMSDSQFTSQGKDTLTAGLCAKAFSLWLWMCIPCPRCKAFIGSFKRVFEGKTKWSAEDIVSPVRLGDDPTMAWQMFWDDMLTLKTILGNHLLAPGFFRVPLFRLLSEDEQLLCYGERFDTIATDACQIGGGGFCYTGKHAGCYFRVAFPEWVVQDIKSCMEKGHSEGDSSQYTIAVVEKAMHTLGMILYGETGKCYVMLQDNQNVVDWVRKGWSKPVRVQNYMRRDVMVARHRDMWAAIQYIHTKDNKLADWLSRSFTDSGADNHEVLAEFRVEVARLGLVATETQVPTELLAQLLAKQVEPCDLNRLESYVIELQTLQESAVTASTQLDRQVLHRVSAVSGNEALHGTDEVVGNESRSDHWRSERDEPDDDDWRSLELGTRTRTTTATHTRVVSLEESGEFEVEKILRVRTHKVHGVQYRVRFCGYSNTHNRWVRPEDCEISELIVAFNALVTSRGDLPAECTKDAQAEQFYYATRPEVVQNVNRAHLLPPLREHRGQISKGPGLDAWQRGGRGETANATNANNTAQMHLQPIHLQPIAEAAVRGVVNDDNCNPNHNPYGNNTSRSVFRDGLVTPAVNLRQSSGDHSAVLEELGSLPFNRSGYKGAGKGGKGSKGAKGRNEYVELPGSHRGFMGPSLVEQAAAASAAGRRGGRQRVELYIAPNDDRLRKAAAETLVNSIAPNTRRTYGDNLKFFLGFCERQHLSPILDGSDKRGEEARLIEYVMYEYAVHGNKYSTIKIKLYAIRAATMDEGNPNPLENKPTLARHMKGIKALRGATDSKEPLPPEAFRNILRQTQGRPILLRATALAIIIGFFFLLRISEFAARDKWYMEVFILLRQDVTFFQNEQLCAWDHPLVNAVELHIRGSKTDQRKQGCRRMQQASGDPILCPVRCMVEWFALTEGSFIPATAPLFSIPHGRDGSEWRVLTRETVTLLMKGAAVDCGLKPKHVATHSIRISGATALLIAGVPAEVVKIMGRWISNAFIGYTRYQAELMAGISQRMVNTSYVVRPF